MTALLALTLISGFLDEPGPLNPTDPASRLEFMKRIVADHPLGRADAPDVAYRLAPEPLLRFNNKVGTVEDGTLFCWLDADDRPVAVVQVYRTTDTGWRQAFSSLSTGPLTNGRVWNPEKPGIEFQLVPGSPRPAGTREARLRQMHDLLKSFDAEMDLEGTRHRLRPLAKPLIRYGKAGTEAVDGALFGFVLTTDPEVLLLLEARQGKNGLEWQYAFAPEASAPLIGSFKGKMVWEFSRTTHGFNREPYFDWGYHASP
ncbi:MAG: hypothetical protein P4L85_20435 [Paludisphaera borealis]|uniref:hypothetical protein n=1 Tax=Paludisphaera borealis TaxID=1387353 RepID=UPI0028417B9A|nr:hypothetical protein [Paludisphaera borealis]MDR3621732.1 hypothetical protein [Paludisphaera borealis]